MKGMKKSVLLVLFLLVLVSCARKSTEPQVTDFRYGTEGIRMEFVQNLPPPRLFDREPFNVMIQVENRGTTTIGQQDGSIFLSGFDNTIITGINTNGIPIPEVEGRGPFIPKGGINVVNFKGVIQSLSGKRIDKYQPTILATACYHYETVASAQVCIDPNPYAATSQQRVCSPGTISPGSQGAPIAVTSVQVDPSPGKTRFTINIQNVGGGDVFKFGGQYLNKCSPYDAGLGFDEIDFVLVADVSISGTKLAGCKPVDNQGFVRLANGMASLYCEYSGMLGQSAYLTPLNIILRYGYRQSIARPIEIRPIA